MGSSAECPYLLGLLKDAASSQGIELLMPDKGYIFRINRNSIADLPYQMGLFGSRCSYPRRCQKYAWF
jgi:hypothetical protein